MVNQIVFGPVPSRRLGKSLGVNNIPAKNCTYSCVYCQLGKTITLASKRKYFYNPKIIYETVYKKVVEAEDKGIKIDYISFVPDGEPTLDINLGKEIKLLNTIGIKTAVLTNSSLLYQKKVREELLEANLVSVKIDGVTESIWRRVNRPHKKLYIDKILDGIETFSEIYGGRLITETMLINNVDYEEEFRRIALFLSKLNIFKAYIAIPTRPPAFEWVKPAEEKIVNKAYIEFSSRLGVHRVEYLIGYEGDAFSSTGDIVNDLLAILSVHPMREEAILKMIKRYNKDPKILEQLISSNKIIQLKYQKYNYYMRKLPSRK